MKLFIHFLITFIVFLGIDLIWLGFIAQNIYANAIGHLMSPNVNWPAAIIFYIIFVVGILYFVVEPALIHQNLTKLVFASALFGFVTYATFDLTSLATLKDWPLNITIIDLVWGTSLSLLVSNISYFIIKLIS